MNANPYVGTLDLYAALTTKPDQIGGLQQEQGSENEVDAVALRSQPRF
jgi:hypothetical protein